MVFCFFWALVCGFWAGKKRWKDVHRGILLLACLHQTQDGTGRNEVLNTSEEKKGNEKQNAGTERKEGNKNEGEERRNKRKL